jgi:hypothetical protein
MWFAYRYIVDGEEEEDYNWVTLNDMFVTPKRNSLLVACMSFWWLTSVTP